MKICLVGNPNCGKSTIFNLLTDEVASVGNWSGVTVKKKHAKFSSNKEIEITDLPGLYLLSNTKTSQDEKHAEDFIKSNEFDLIINVVDVANLKKSLFLTLQLIKLKKPIILVLNMLDKAGKQGKAVNVELISNSLKIPVLEMVAKKGYGIEALKELIESDIEISDIDIQENSYHKFIKKVVGKSVSYTSLRRRQFSDKVDDLLLNRYFGLPLFFLIMFCVFSTSIYIGTRLQEVIADIGQVFLIDGMKSLVQTLSLPNWLGIVLGDGFGGGVTLVLQFVPIIAILYLLLSLLEESGYMSRAAFILDKIMSLFGMSGKAFFPLVTGFGCNVPSIIATRILDNPKERIAAALMIPFMSCGARLPVYALFCAAFFPEASGLIIFSLYAFGIFVAFLTSFMLKIFLKNTERAHLVMELPCYNIPEVKSVITRVYSKVKDFVLNAGKLILIAFVLLKFGSQLNADFNIVSESSSESMLSIAAKSITPIFRPIGVEEDNWPAVVGIITGAVAKEAVIGSLGALYLNMDYNLDDDIDPKEIDLLQKNKIVNSMQSRFYSKVGVYAYLLFILLYFPCISTFSVIAREFSYKWAIISVSWSTGIAYVVAATFFQIGILVSS